MNTLTITQTHKCFIIEYRDQKLYVLNERSLVIQLKKVFKFDMTAIASIQHVLLEQATVDINLDHVGAA